jgi:hypothetical protein
VAVGGGGRDEVLAGMQVPDDVGTGFRADPGAHGRAFDPAFEPADAALAQAVGGGLGIGQGRRGDGGDDLGGEGV